MSKLLEYAQKGVILDPTKTKILASGYTESKYLPKKLIGKTCLPGGRITVGSQPNESFITEVRKETGITITPLLPFYTWTWIYEKDGKEKQIVASARLALYEGGEISEPGTEEETSLRKAKWIDIADVEDEFKNWVFDEVPALEKFLEYRENNPFVV